MISSVLSLGFCLGLGDRLILLFHIFQGLGFHLFRYRLQTVLPLQEFFSRLRVKRINQRITDIPRQTYRLLLHLLHLWLNEVRRPARNGLLSSLVPFQHQLLDLIRNGDWRPPV